jgi:2-polyprenyl-6-methoxyphenol hydroxylase-like FAD-dependent oxidoreductase
MPKQTATDVLICGAGTAGLSLAIDLARRGVDFRLIEKAETPFQGSRGKGIQPTAKRYSKITASSTGCSPPEAPIRRSAGTTRTAVLSIRLLAMPVLRPRRNRITRR